MLMAQLSEVIGFCVIFGVATLLSVFTGFGYLRRAKREALKNEMKRLNERMAAGLCKSPIFYNFESHQQKKFRISHEKLSEINERGQHRRDL